MKRSTATKITPLLVAGIFLAFFSLRARADDTAPNPKYSAWSGFKPGSSSTVEADLTVQGNKIHLTMVKTLISIDSEKAVVQTQSTVNIMGRDNNAPPRQETIAAKAGDESYQSTGEKDVQAMGKTFKCKAYQATRQPGPTPPGAPGAAGNAPGVNTAGGKATVYISEQVPGGVVRLEAVGQAGQNMVFILTGMDAK